MVELKNPHGTATRQDLVEMMKIIQIIITGSPVGCFIMERDLIYKLNDPRNPKAT